MKNAVFENGVAPQVGKLEVPSEEGLIQKLSRKVTADTGSGCKLLDVQFSSVQGGGNVFAPCRHKASRSFYCGSDHATLAEDAAMGLLSNQTYQLIAAHCIQKSAQAVVKAIRRNAARNTTFHY